MASGKTEPITFPAAVAKVQTLSDGGIRLTLDLPETEIIPMGWLAQCQRDGVVLSVTCQPCITGLEQGNGEKQDDVGAGSIRKSYWTNSKGSCVNYGSGDSGQPDS